jgi:hypothetical protein
MLAMEEHLTSMRDFVLYCCWESKSLSRVFSCPRFSLSILMSTVVFYSTRQLQLHCDLGPDRWPQGDWTPIP